MGEFEFVYPDLNLITVPFTILVLIILIMIGTIIYFTKVELKNKGE